MHKFNSILVTGGAGFIGSNFIRYILQHETNIQIVNLDKLTYAGSLLNLQQLPSAHRYHFIHGDINDKQLVTRILQDYRIDTIVHFAAESHVDRSIAKPSTFIETNIMGTFTLLEAAREQWLSIEKRGLHECRFHHISTDEVYGALEPDDEAFIETTAYQPRSPYSASKAASDHLVAAYFHTYGLPVTISNCSNNYGPYQHAEKFIPTIIRACLTHNKIPVYGKGKNIRDWLYVDDHCRGIIQIIKQGKVGERYNLGANNEWDNLSLVNYICSLMDKLIPHTTSYKNLIQFVTDRKGHDFRYAIDNKKIQEELNWSIQNSFESGLKKTIAFYSALFFTEEQRSPYGNKSASPVPD